MDGKNVEGRKRAKVSVGAMLSVMELVIAIGVFAVISTFLLRFFTVANRLSDEAREVSKASITAEGVLEHLKGVGVDRTVEEFGLTRAEDGLRVLLDENFQVIKDKENEKSFYVMEIKKEEQKDASGSIIDYKITITKRKNRVVLFDLNGKCYEKVVIDE